MTRSGPSGAKSPSTASLVCCHASVAIAATTATAAEPDRETGPSRTTTVRDHGTAYTVMKGELHIHADPAARPPAAD
ncbi:hypothetical protein [Streptomyces carpaticus]|uniref:hypothetical protein n=1 Tax=Streptomyces carpaticus TaxID=285558 RepID=UPI0031F93A23